MHINKIPKILLTMSVIIVSMLYSCQYRYYTDDEYDSIVYSKKNKDGSKIIYLVDSIPYDSANFTIIGNPNELRQYFYIPNDYLKGKRKIKEKDIIKKTNTILKFQFSRLSVKDDDEYYPDVIRRRWFNEEGWFKYYFTVPPSYLRVFMMRGIDYNVLYCNNLDARWVPYKFPYKYAYYKIVVPVWKQEVGR